MASKTTQVKTTKAKTTQATKKAPNLKKGSDGRPIREKKLIMLGTAPNVSRAPYDDPNVDIWGTGGTVAMDSVKRVDVIFEMHPRRYWGKEHVLKVLNEYQGQIVMADHYEEIPNSVRYPIEQVREVFYMSTMGEHLYVTNTVAYMFALAYLEGYREIETYGIYMEHETEYEHQRVNCEFYVGFLHARGVEVTIHGGEVLKARFEYGLQEPSFVSKLVSDGAGLNNAQKELESQIETKKRDLWMQEGAVRYNKNLRREFGGY